MFPFRFEKVFYFSVKFTAMNKTTAKQLAEKVTNEDLRQMFLNAQKNIKDWNAMATVNKGLTKGTAFNILSKAFPDGGFSEKNIAHIAKRNMIWEFGDYLPEHLKPINEPNRKINHAPVHQEPNFLDDVDEIF